MPADGMSTSYPGEDGDAVVPEPADAAEAQRVQRAQEAARDAAVGEHDYEPDYQDDGA